MISPQELQTVPGKNDRSQLQEGLLILNPQGTVIYANQVTADFFGFPLKKITGAPFFSLFSPQERHMLSEYDRNLHNEHALQFLLSRGIERELRTYALRIHPIQEQGKTFMVVVTLHDITLMDQLKKERDCSLVRERTCKESISHHFFNPLAIAKGYLQLALDESNNGSVVKLESAYAAVERIENAVKTIIRTGDLSQIQ